MRNIKTHRKEEYSFLFVYREVLDGEKDQQKMEEHGPGADSLIGKAVRKPSLAGRGMTVPDEADL